MQIKTEHDSKSNWDPDWRLQLKVKTVNAHVFFSSGFRNGANPVVHQTCLHLCDASKKMLACSLYGPLTKTRKYRIDPCWLFNSFARVFSAYRIPPPDSQGGGYFKYRVGRESNKLDCTLPPTLAWGVQGHKLEWGCKTDWFGISALKKNSWLFCYFSATTVLRLLIETSLRQQQKTTTVCLFGFSYAQTRDETRSSWANIICCDITQQICETLLLR